MIVTLHHRFNSLSASPSRARDRQSWPSAGSGLSHAAEGSAAATLRRAFSKVFPAVRECLEVSRTDRDLTSLAKHERTRAALRRVQIAAVHGSGPSLGGVAAHKAARGSS